MIINKYILYSFLNKLKSIKIKKQYKLNFTEYKYSQSFANESFIQNKLPRSETVK